MIPTIEICVIDHNVSTIRGFTTHTSAAGRLAARQSAQHMNKNARIQNVVRSQQTQSSFSILVIKQKR